MTRLKLHYAMQKWHPADFMSSNLLRVQDGTFTQWTILNPKKGAKNIQLEVFPIRKITKLVKCRKPFAI